MPAMAVAAAANATKARATALAHTRAPTPILFCAALELSN